MECNGNPGFLQELSTFVGCTLVGCYLYLVQATWSLNRQNCTDHRFSEKVPFSLAGQQLRFRPARRLLRQLLPPPPHARSTSASRARSLPVMPPPTLHDTATSTTLIPAGQIQARQSEAEDGIERCSTRSFARFSAP